MITAMKSLLWKIEVFFLFFRKADCGILDSIGICLFLSEATEQIYTPEETFFREIANWDDYEEILLDIKLDTKRF